MNSLAIVLLSNNVVRRPGLLAEHGLAVGVACGARRLLFDTGQGLVLAHNAAALGFDLAAVTDVVLSHGHYDHTGGLAQVAKAAAAPPRLWMHPAAVRSRYSRRKDGSVHEIGMPADCRAAAAFLVRPAPSAREGRTELMPGVFATGPVPRIHAWEEIQGLFWDAAERIPDDFPDEQAVWFDTSDGVVALLGCAHAGCINTLECIHAQAGGRPFSAIIGGTHLGDAGAPRLARTIEALRRFAPRLLVPLHCTGEAALRLKQEFPTTCHGGGVGDTMTFTLRPA